jgi:predicted NBD/HSP70 family sugar kinase
LQEAAHGLPVTLENDARCFVLAEARFGAGRGAQHVCGITLGTGCGGGVIANGQLVRGARGGAGEVWSIPLREHFLEYYVSGVGLVRTYQECGGVADETTTSVQIADRARAGEAAAVAAWHSFGNDVAMLCETMLALLEPEIIVIGGSIAQAHDLFGAKFEKVRNHRHTRIAFAELGAAAGVIGAAALNF